MDDSTPDRNPFDRLAGEFAGRFRRGEHPSLTEYTARHPELADEILRVFPAIVVMERIKPGGDGDGSGDAVPPRGRRAIP
jgi:hypothetical protein